MDTTAGQTSGHGKEVILAGLDLIWSRYYSSMVLAFRPRPEQSQNDVLESLQSSLEQTCLQIPIFQGKIFEKPSDQHRPALGQCELRTSPDWNPKLVHNDLSQTHLDYDDLQDEGFPPSYFENDKLLPPNLAFAPPSSGVPVVLCQANFIRGGLLLGIRVHHAVGDGTGIMLLIKTWAKQSRLLQQKTSSSPELAFGTISYDRSLLHSTWEAHNNPIADATSASQWRMLGLLPPSGSYKIPAPYPDMAASIFYVSADSFKTLTLEGQRGSKSDTTSNVSGNDVVAALIWRASIRARRSACIGSVEQYLDDKITYLDMVLNGRAFLGSTIPWDYIANMVLFASPSMTIGELLDESMALASLSEKVHEAATSITKEQALAAYGLATTIPDYKHVPFTFTTMDGAEAFVNSFMPLQVNDASFGDLFLNEGCPDISRAPVFEYGGYCRRIVSLPMNPQGGFEIYFEMTAKEVEALKADQEFAKYAQFVC